MSEPRNLTDLEAGQTAKISRIHTRDEETLKKLIAIGLLPDTDITLIKKKPTYLFAVGNTRFAVDRELAQKILVNFTTV